MCISVSISQATVQTVDFITTLDIVLTQLIGPHQIDTKVLRTRETATEMLESDLGCLLWPLTHAWCGYLNCGQVYRSQALLIYIV